MAIRDIFKVSWKTFVNPAGWLDFSTLVQQNVTIIAAIKSLFGTPVPVSTEETFEQARDRLNLTEDDIQKSGRLYRLYARGFFLTGILLLIYSFYLLFTLALIDFILCVSVTGLFLAFAFKYDFWAFQIRNRKLGATFADWKQSIMGSANKR